MVGKDGVEESMILLKQQQVDDLKAYGSLVIHRDKDGFGWKLGRVYKIKTWIYSKNAAAYAKIREVRDQVNRWEIVLDKALVFDYLKQKHGSVPQLEIEL